MGTRGTVDSHLHDGDIRSTPTAPHFSVAVTQSCPLSGAGQGLVFFWRHVALVFLRKFQLNTTAAGTKLYFKNRLRVKVRYEDPCGSDLGFPDDGVGLDLRGLHYGHGRLEDCRGWRNGRLLPTEGGLVLVQPLEVMFYRLHSCEQLLRLPCALVSGG